MGCILNVTFALDCFVVSVRCYVLFCGCGLLWLFLVFGGDYAVAWVLALGVVT